MTKRSVDAAKAAVDELGRPRETTLWDATVKGFGLRISPKGTKSFVLIYRAGRGRTAPLRKWTIGVFGSPWTVETARREAVRLLGHVAAGNDPAGDKAEKRLAVAEGSSPKGSVRAVVGEWLARDQADNRTAAEVRRVIERDVLPVWGDRPFAEIRKRDVIELLDGIADRGARTLANRVLAYVRRLFNWAASRDLIDVNPAQFVEKPVAETRRERVLDDAELAEVWRAADSVGGPFGDGVKLLILTAMRRDEIFSLSWPEIDLDKGTASLPAARVKAKEGRTIPLSPPALAIVAGRPRFTASEWVLTVRGAHPFSNFGHAKRGLDSRILLARQEADGKAEPMPDWRLHDLRRSVATGLQRLGVRLEVVEAVLGHVAGSRAGIVGVYQRHRFSDEARGALDLWAQHLEALTRSELVKTTPIQQKAES